MKRRSMWITKFVNFMFCDVLSEIPYQRKYLLEYHSSQFPLTFLHVLRKEKWPHFFLYLVRGCIYGE